MNLVSEEPSHLKQELIVAAEAQNLPHNKQISSSQITEVKEEESYSIDFSTISELSENDEELIKLDLEFILNKITPGK